MGFCGANDLGFDHCGTLVWHLIAMEIDLLLLVPGGDNHNEFTGRKSYL
jgi:hypothetical protein